MEKHIFKFGGGSWAFIVPKGWVDKNMLGKDSALNLAEDELGNLLISARVRNTQEAELILNSKLNDEVASRWAGLYYRKGIKKLRIYSKDSVSSQFSKIESTVNRMCPGFEVISRSKNEMIIEDFTDIKEVSVEKIISRMRSLIGEELNEIGTEDAEEIKKLEDLVNRFFMLGIRHVNMTQGIDSIKHFKVLQLLETISDQIYELSKQNRVYKRKGIFEKLRKELDLCFEGLEGNGKSIESTIEFRNQIHKDISSMKLGALENYLLKEISKNMVKVAEMGLYIKDNRGI